jgi:hypothetical protein
MIQLMDYIKFIMNIGKTQQELRLSWRPSQNHMQKTGHSISSQFKNQGFLDEQSLPGETASPKVSKILLTSPKRVDKNAGIFV